MPNGSISATTVAVTGVGSKPGLVGEADALINSDGSDATAQVTDTVSGKLETVEDKRG